MVELAEVKQQIGGAKGNAFTGRSRIPNRNWSDLLNQEAGVKAELARIDLDLVRINREASEQRWRAETAARNCASSVVHHAMKLCEDDSDANWHRLEDALDRLRRECPDYIELHNLRD